MKRWNDFLESLATGGGAIVSLMFFVIIFGFVSLHIMWHKEYSEQMVTTFTGLLTGFAGALLGALTARSKPPNGATQTTTATLTQTNSVTVPDEAASAPKP